jgi:carbamoyl-phosphate synthase large subunit
MPSRKELRRSILLSTSNAPSSVYAIQGLKELGYRVVAGDANPDAVGKLFANRFVVLPLQSDPAYLDEVLRIVKTERVNVFVPTGEAEALEASRRRDAFNALGCTLVAANTRTLEIAFDKSVLFSFFRERGSIPMLWFRSISSVEDFDRALTEAGDRRLCMKPAIGSGSRGFAILDDAPMPPDEFFLKKQAFPRFPKSIMREMLASTETFPKLVLMEYLEGVHYDSNMICREGEILFQSVKTREEAKIGTITKGTIVKNPRIERINVDITEAMKTTGLISTQFVGDMLIEINPRWSTSLSFRSINEYAMSIEVWEKGAVTYDREDLDDYTGLRMIRYWDIATFKE